MEADKDGDGKLNFEEFTSMVAKTVGDITVKMFTCLTLLLGYCEADDTGRPVLAVLSVNHVVLEDIWQPLLIHEASIDLQRVARGKAGSEWPCPRRLYSNSTRCVVTWHHQKWTEKSYGCSDKSTADDVFAPALGFGGLALCWLATFKAGLTGFTPFPLASAAA